MKTCVQYLAILLCVFLVSCNEVDIVHDLQERDANEILVVLNKHSIQAVKEKNEKNQEVTWVIKVQSADEQLARSVLVANNLPRVRLGGLMGICQDAGMILTPKTEKCRELLAYKGEIVNLLESVACVVSADVVLNIPDKPDFPDEKTVVLHPTATASVKYLKDCTSGTKLSEQSVQDIVANAVSGLDPRDVTVVISYLDAGLPAVGTVGNPDENQGQEKKCPELVAGASSSDSSVALEKVAGLSMDGESAKKFKLVSATFLVLFLLISASLIYVLLKMAKSRQSDTEERSLAKIEENPQ